MHLSAIYGPSFDQSARVWVLVGLVFSPTCHGCFSALSPNASSLTLKFDGRIGWLRKQTQSADRTLYPLSTPPPASSRRAFPLAADPPPQTVLYGGRRLFLVDVWRPRSQTQLMMATDARDFSSDTTGSVVEKLKIDSFGKGSNWGVGGVSSLQYLGSLRDANTLRFP